MDDYIRGAINMSIFKIILIVMFSATLPTSCTQKSDTVRLTAKEWKVGTVTIGMKEKYIPEDTLLSGEIKKAFMGRVYKFNEDGSFAVASGEKSFNGKWNFGKTDTVLLWHDMGYEGINLIVLRSAENSHEEVWYPINGTSIFVNYTHETKDDMIQVSLVPTPIEGGTVNLYLSSKKE